MTKCAGVRKSQCNHPCTWIVGNGCVKHSHKSNDNKRVIITNDIDKPRKRLQTQQLNHRVAHDVQETIHRKPRRDKITQGHVNSRNSQNQVHQLKQLQHVTSKLKSELTQLQSKYNHLLKDHKDNEAKTKSDIKMMKELSQKNLMLHSRLRTVEERLAKVNKENDKHLHELHACTSELEAIKHRKRSWL